MVNFSPLVDISSLVHVLSLKVYAIIFFLFPDHQHQRLERALHELHTEVLQMRSKSRIYFSPFVEKRFFFFSLHFPPECPA